MIFSVYLLFEFSAAVLDCKYCLSNITNFIAIYILNSVIKSVMHWCMDDVLLSGRCHSRPTHSHFDIFGLAQFVLATVKLVGCSCLSVVGLPNLLLIFVTNVY